jgi:hypothetical protein
MQVNMAPLDEPEKPAMTLCRHCEQGCTIYEQRPKACRDFQCMWLQTQQLPPARRLPLSERPDRTGIVMEVNQKGTVVATCSRPDAWRADPARKRLMSFVNLGFTVSIKYADGRLFILERDGTATELEFVDLDPATGLKGYRRVKAAGVSR